MNTEPPTPVLTSKRPGFLRRLFSRRTLMRVAFVAVCLVTLATLAVVLKNWHAARALRAWRTAAEARGERFDWAALIPTMPPPENNFAATPLFKPLFDYELMPAKGSASLTADWVKKDPTGFKRVSDINVISIRDDAKPEAGKLLDSLNGWRRGERANLDAWADYYRGNPDYPVPAEPLASARTVLAALGKFDAELDELARAAARPESVFPVHLEEGLAVKLPHLGPLRNLERVTVLRALAAGADGNRARAFEDILLAQRLAEALRTEPWLISVLVHAAQHSAALQPVWESLAERRLTEGQLATLQAELGKANLIEHLARGIRGERAVVSMFFESGAILSSPGEFQPRTWLFRYDNELFVNRYCTEDLLPLIHADARQVEVQAGFELNDRLPARLQNPLLVLARLVIPMTGPVFKNVARAQAEQNMAIIACALERWALAHGGGYPDSPTALVPEFLAKLPTDPVNGQPLGYRRTDDGRYALWSAGARIHPDKDVGTAPPPQNYDWVWSYQKL